MTLIQEVFRLDNFAAAMQALREHWQRAVLSALGIMVGSLAIVLLVSIATGVEYDVRSQVEDIGVNILVVIPGRVESGSFNPNLGGASYLQASDADALEEVTGVVRTATWTFVGGGARNGKKSASSLIVATDPDWFAMHSAQLREGRTLQAQDGAASVAVIGSVAARELFGEESALGKALTINGEDYKVVGVLQDKRSEQSIFSMGSFQNLVYIPLGRLKQVQLNLQTDRIMVQIRPEAEPKALIKDLDRVFERRLDRQQFQVLTQEDLLGLVYRLMGILTWLLTGLTSIALFVGGVGIMAVMLMSVNERAKEIGIRKTLGARNRDVFSQFLAEAVLLALLGGLAGLAISYAVCLALYHYTPVKPMITPGIVAMSFGVSFGVGAVFGLIPAMHAARKDPIAALRSE